MVAFPMPRRFHFISLLPLAFAAFELLWAFGVLIAFGTELITPRWISRGV